MISWPTFIRGEVIANAVASQVPDLAGLIDGVAVIGSTLTALIAGQPATGPITWLQNGVAISGATGASLVVPAATGVISVRVDGVESSAHAIVATRALTLSWTGTILHPGDTITVLADGVPAGAGMAELLRNGAPVALTNGQYSVEIGDHGALFQARQSDLPSNLSATVTVAATPQPTLVTAATTSGSLTEGETHVIDPGDTWQSDGAPALIAAREYRLVLDGVPGPAQSDPALIIPAGTAGQAAEPQLRARTATSVFSAWETAGPGFTVAAQPVSLIHVDATLGDDAAPGSADQPIRSLAQAAIVAAGIGDGAHIRLAAGSLWRETLDLSALTGVTVEAYGDLVGSSLPFINAADILTGFQDSTARGDGHTEVYSLSHAHEAPAGQAAGGPSVFENGEMLHWVADLATCQATPGSFFHDGASSATTPVMLYVHPSDSSDPDTNGRLYEASTRAWALRVGDDANVIHLRAANQLHDNGAIRFGHRGLIDSCLVHGAPVHDALGESGEYRNCIAWHPQSDSRSGASALEFQTAAAYAGMTGRWAGCVVAGPPDSALPRAAQITGFGGHVSGGGAEYTWSLEDCAAFGADLVAQDVSDLTITRVSIRNGAATFAPTTAATDLEIIADRRFQTGREMGIEGNVWSSGVADGLRLSIPADFDLAGLTDCAGGTITRSILHVNEGAGGQATGSARCVRLRQAGQTIGITGSILATPMGRGNNLVQADGAVSMANDNNVLWELADGTRYSTPDGTHQTSLAPVQAAGQELSAIELDPKIANPIAGDWTVAGAVGNRGLERPDVTYPGRPLSLAAALDQVRGILPALPADPGLAAQNWTVDDTAIALDAAVAAPDLIFTYSASALPAGLTLDQATGQLTGVITAPEAGTIGLTARDQHGRTLSYSIAYTAALRPQATAAAALGPFEFTENTAIAARDLSIDFTAHGNTLTLAMVTPLPAGLTVSAAGSMAGTPTAISAPATYTLRATDEYGRTTDSSFTLEIGADTGDTTAPVVNSFAYSDATQIATLDVTEASDAATVYWALVANPSTPTAAQIKAGTGGGVLEAGSFAITAGGDSDTISVTDMAGDEVHIVIEDAAGNDTGAPSTANKTMITGIVIDPPAGGTYFTTDTAAPTYFVDPTNVPAGTTHIQFKMKVRFNTMPANQARIFAQESTGFDVFFATGADPDATRLTLEDAGGTKKFSNHITQDSQGADVVLGTAAWYEITGAFDFAAGANGQWRLTVDGTAHPAVDAASTAGPQEFQSNREVSFFAQSSGANALPGGTDVEYFEVYFNTTLHKRLAGSDGAAALNADAWKRGGDLTVS